MTLQLSVKMRLPWINHTVFGPLKVCHKSYICWGLNNQYLFVTGRNPGKYQQLCPEGELADLQSQGGPDRGCKDMTLDGQTNTVCVCFTDECNKSKEMAMKSGNDKGVGNVIFIALSLIFLLQFK